MEQQKLMERYACTVKTCRCVPRINLKFLHVCTGNTNNWYCHCVPMCGSESYNTLQLGK